MCIRDRVLREGEPVLREDICCWFLCKVLDSIETLTHTVFLAEVTAGSDEYKMCIRDSLGFLDKTFYV